MRRYACLFLLPLALATCTRGEPVRKATMHASSSASATVGGIVLQATPVPLADLNRAVAQGYGIAGDEQGVLLLVTVRDTAGNGIAPGDLQLQATAAVLPDPAKPLALRAIRTDDMTDYIGVLHAVPPASVQFRLTATRGGARSEFATTLELSPR